MYNVTVADINKFKNYRLIVSTLSSEEILKDASTIEELVDKLYLCKIKSSDYDTQDGDYLKYDYNIDFYIGILENEP